MSDSGSDDSGSNPGGITFHRPKVRQFNALGFFYFSANGRSHLLIVSAISLLLYPVGSKLKETVVEIQ